MVIDTSALVAILLGEPDAGVFAGAIAADPETVDQRIHRSGNEHCHRGKEGGVRGTGA